MEYEQLIALIQAAELLEQENCYGYSFKSVNQPANDIFHYWIKILRELLPASLLAGAKTKKTGKKGLQSFSDKGFTSKTVKTLMGMGLRSFYPFDVFSLPSRGFNPIYHENLSKSR